MHGTVVALDGSGVLLRGPSGSGKSDLALRLLSEGWTLIADDRVILYPFENRILARCPDALLGLLEVRGQGVVRLMTGEWTAAADVRLVVDLVARPDDVARMPEPALFRHSGIDCPLISLYPFQASAAARLRLALLLISEPGKLVQ
ncbi:MAG: HPr kinase/phosphatase C-terminal domain-containing protein [Minwuia sp.]|nr:HPr kinase/phosphatase C-terminal domain-containing protein [Minwuia sp.]